MIAACETRDDNDIATRYSALVANLTDHEVNALWAAALFGRTPTTERLREAADALRALRDDLGRTKQKSPA